MSNPAESERINDEKCSEVVVENKRSIRTIPLTTGNEIVGTKKLLIIISFIIAAALVTTTVAILIAIIIQRNTTATAEIPKATTTTATKRTTAKKTATATTSTSVETTTTEPYRVPYSSPRIYSTGSSSKPWSISVADVNSDDRPDIIVANQLKHNVGVFFNSGNGTFLSQKTYTTGVNSYPQDVSVVDVNGDNKPDIIVANNGENNVGVLLNSGDGTFLPQTAYITGDRSYPPSVAVGDVNNDNKADIIVTNQNINSISVLLNSGDGTFLPQTIYSVANGSAVACPSVVDVNGDSKPDIIVVNGGKNNIGIFFNTGDGKFLNQKTYPTGLDTNPRFASVVDVNNDNKPDLIVSNYNKNNIGVHFNSDNGTFLPPTTYSTGSGSNPRSVSVVDINGDDKRDIIVANFNGNNIGVFLNIGNGTFLPQMTYPTGLRSNPAFASVMDVNNDSKPDIIVANGGADNIGVLLAL